MSGQPTGATEEYTWDHRNRLTAVTFKTSPGGSTVATVIYAYDVFDRKVRRDVDSDGNGIVNTREYYLHDGDDVLIDMYDQDANGPLGQTINVRYLHGLGVDQILAQENTGANETYWHLGDHLQTTRDIVYYDDTTGQTVVAEHLDYDAFGNVVTASAITRYLYTAREYDVSTGLQYNRARWYDSGTGRWISEDPIGFAAGDANLNRYVGNSPTNATDPSGLEVYVAVRDLDFAFAIGSHQFLIIVPDDPDRFPNTLLACYGMADLQMTDLGGERTGFTIAGHNVDGRLQVIANQSADVEAAQEYFNKSRRLLKFDWSTKVDLRSPIVDAREVSDTRFILHILRRSYNRRLWMG